MLEGTGHRVLFQNSAGNINMGIFFNDPDVGFDDEVWYNELAMEMHESLNNNVGLISIDEELKTRSCYVELHRKGTINIHCVACGLKMNADI